MNTFVPGTAALMTSLLVLCGPPALAASTLVEVQLLDKGETSMEMLGKAAPMMMGSTHAQMMMATMTIVLDKPAVPAGEVTFEVTNASKETIHEMILSPVADLATPLPYVAEAMRVDEDAAGSLGEVSELDPGKSGALTVTLGPGTYILYCNIPGHYVLGMWALLEVKG